MYKAGVITISDTCSKDPSLDKGGKLVSKILNEDNFEVVRASIVSDDIDEIVSELRSYVDDEITVIITTGGTGFSKRDNTPEATNMVIEKKAMGFSEIMRVKSYEINKNAILSRGVSGIAKNSIIINLPGSLKAIEEGLELILKPLSHGAGTLIGDYNLHKHN